MNEFQNQQASSSKRYRKLEQIKELYDRIQSSTDCRYVAQFVKKFPEEYNQRELGLLLGLLKERWAITEYQMIQLLRIEKGRQLYDDFKTKILSKSPHSFKDIVAAYLQLVGDYHQQKLPMLARLLDEAGYSQAKNDNQIISEVAIQLEAAELWRFEEKLLADQPAVSIVEIDTFTGVEFEAFLAKIYARMGYSVEFTKTTGDQGADLLASKSDEITVIQAKRYSTDNKVGNSAVQEVVAAIRHYDARYGIVVTSSYFTPAAIALAQSNKIVLVDRDQLVGLINRYYW